MGGQAKVLWSRDEHRQQHRAVLQEVMVSRTGGLQPERLSARGKLYPAYSRQTEGPTVLMTLDQSIKLVLQAEARSMEDAACEMMAKHSFMDFRHHMYDIL